MVLSPHVHKTIRLNSSCIVENLNRLPSPRTASAQSLESRVLTWTSPTEISDSTQSRSDSSNGRKVMPTSSHIRSLRRSVCAQLPRNSSSRALILSGKPVRSSSMRVPP